MHIDEVQADVDDVTKAANELVEHLTNAECCETIEDLQVNLENAVRTAGEIQAAAKKLYKLAMRLQ